jgi:hypothetical protein
MANPAKRNELAWWAVKAVAPIADDAFTIRHMKSHSDILPDAKRLGGDWRKDRHRPAGLSSVPIPRNLNQWRCRARQQSVRQLQLIAKGVPVGEL